MASSGVETCFTRRCVPAAAHRFEIELRTVVNHTKESKDEQLLILRGHEWNAGFFSDFIQSIDFDPESRGTMFQGDGQAVKIEASFRYELPESGRLIIEFLDTPSCYDPEDLAFERTEDNSTRQLVFDLIPGPHEVDRGTMGGMVKDVFAWQLRFGSEPFPLGYEPAESLLEYYGWPLRSLGPA